MAFSDPNLLSDTVLWERLIRGDADSFTLLFKKYYAVHCARAQYLLKSSYEAEETVQELFKKLWENHAALPHALSPAAYLSQAVRNACLNRLNRQGRLLHEDLAGQRIAYEESMDTEELLHLQRRIENAIGELPEGCQTIFRMSRFEQKTYPQIAEQLQLSPKTVENQMGIALKKLRQQLADLRFILFFIFLLGVKAVWLVFKM